MKKVTENVLTAVASVVSIALICLGATAEQVPATNMNTQVASGPAIVSMASVDVTSEAIDIVSDVAVSITSSATASIQPRDTVTVTLSLEEETNNVEVTVEPTQTPTPQPVATPEPEPTPAVQEEVQSGEYLGRFKLTAYCSCAKCCGQWSPERGGKGTTSSGTYPQEGRTVGCNVLPAGTHILINGHEYIVEDTGNMKGQTIDVYMGSHSAALKFGVQYADVYRAE